MVIIFCFNNVFEVLKKVLWCSCGYYKYIIMADISKALKWNPIELFINLLLVRC